jgi:hypothetical protein
VTQNNQQFDKRFISVFTSSVATRIFLLSNDYMLKAYEQQKIVYSVIASSERA